MYEVKCACPSCDEILVPREGDGSTFPPADGPVARTGPSYRHIFQCACCQEGYCSMECMTKDADNHDRLPAHQVYRIMRKMFNKEVANLIMYHLRVLHGRSHGRLQFTRLDNFW